MKTLLVVSGVLALACPAMASYMTNGDFEGGFTGTAPTQVADGWTRYVYGATQASSYYFARELATIHGGSYSHRVSRGNYARNDRGAGIYQTFSADVGDAFVFESWVYAASNSNNAKLSMRLDWDGGTNRDQATALHTWSQAANTWTWSNRKGLQASATSGAVTLFLDIIGATGSNVNGNSFWDDVIVKRTHVPEAIAFSGVTGNSVDIDVTPGQNHAGAQYAISVTGGAFGAAEGTYWVQPDGSIGTNKNDSAFNTDAGWGITTVLGLADNTAYAFKAVARYDADYRQETYLGAPAAVTTPEPAVAAMLGLAGLIILRRRR